MKKCYYCQADKPAKGHWIEENHWEGDHGKSLKEVYVGFGNFGVNTIMPEPTRKDPPKDTIYYCSLKCLHFQMDKENDELWELGDCKECKKPIAVINQQCGDLEHKRLGALFPLDAKSAKCLSKKHINTK